ncbi:Zinc finger and SCAN domain-containing protein 29 [Frankliniella fusca]|uniref:Zinc finger and SCAN domain-containing protein 29 n=1 Tax=Frankliniella fusca TaxID=407009 RepID=A0AAE1LQS9_9NEOP|nr:Zinc finger and SCAN domain-containing protein 29 [Frankliniella fusca]
MSGNVVPYEIVNAENGHVWQVYVTEAEVAALDLDHKKRFRLLKQLKEGNVAPISQWDTTTSSNSLSTALVPVVTGTEALPSTSKPVRAQGAKGAVWKGNSATSFLNCCLPYRKWLRHTVPQHMWQQVSEDLFQLGLDYSWEQLKAKMKTLKRQFNEAKRGQHNGDQWIHYWLMSYIFDDQIGNGNTTLAPEGFTGSKECVENLSVIEFDAPMLSSTVISPVAENAVSCGSNLPGEVEEEAQTSLVHSMGAASVSDAAACDVDADVNDQELTEEAHFADDISNNNNNNLLEDFNASVPGKILTDINLLRSPAKKKKKTAVFTISSTLSPRKTPTKRKVPKNQLQLGTSDAHKLVSECLTRKAYLLKDTIPLHVWKEISAAMGGTITWQVCRDKFLQMDESFKNTWLPLKGLMGGGKWAHYTAFCNLYDIPEDYFSILNASNEWEDGIEELGDSGDENVAVQNDTELWTHELVLLLISLFKPRRQQFEGSKSGMRHNYLYARISEGLKEKGYSRSWKQCKSKITSLKATFREEFDKCGSTGAAPSQWPFYQEMLDVYDGTASLNAPVGLSAGMGLEYTVDGEKISGTRTGTRTRPILQTKKMKEPTAKRPIFKNWQQEVQQISIEQKGQLVKQVEIMNSLLCESSKDRKAFFSAFAAKYL